MKKMLLGIGMLLLATPVSAGMAVLPEHYSLMRDIIELQGFSCKSVDGGFAEDKAYRGGIIFKIYCDNDALVYRVISGGPELCAEPWSAKPARCQ